jgi:hypothetical protein
MFQEIIFRSLPNRRPRTPQPQSFLDDSGHVLAFVDDVGILPHLLRGVDTCAEHIVELLAQSRQCAWVLAQHVVAVANGRGGRVVTGKQEDQHIVDGALAELGVHGFGARVDVQAAFFEPGFEGEVDS